MVLGKGALDCCVLRFDQIDRVLNHLFNEELSVAELAAFTSYDSGRIRLGSSRGGKLSIEA